MLLYLQSCHFHFRIWWNYKRTIRSSVCLLAVQAGRQAEIALSTNTPSKNENLNRSSMFANKKRKITTNKKIDRKKLLSELIIRATKPTKADTWISQKHNQSRSVLVSLIYVYGKRLPTKLKTKRIKKHQHIHRIMHTLTRFEHLFMAIANMYTDICVIYRENPEPLFFVQRSSFCRWPYARHWYLNSDCLSDNALVDLWNLATRFFFFYFLVRNIFSLHLSLCLSNGRGSQFFRLDSIMEAENERVAKWMARAKISGNLCLFFKLLKYVVANQQTKDPNFA